MVGLGKRKRGAEDGRLLVEGEEHIYVDEVPRFGFTILAVL
jgi:hypothetical protein